jgi:hypothetical protein
MSATITAFSVVLLAATAIDGAFAFQAPAAAAAVLKHSTALNVAVDPTVVSKKDYEDICGVTLNESELLKRLEATNYLYPKHVEVVKDIAPIAGEMVDEIVSSCACLLTVILIEITSTAMVMHIGFD